MSEETEVTPRRRRVSAEEAVTREPALAGAAQVAPASTKTLTKEQRLAKARQSLAAQQAANTRGGLDPALQQENRLRKMAGLPPIVPPVQTFSLMQTPDPTIIIDGDGLPTGNPDMPTTIVPRGDMGGGKIDTRITRYKHLQMEPQRYRADCPHGTFHAGEVVESPFGVHMQHPTDELEAQYWAKHHPTNGVDAQADALAKLAALNKPGYRSVETVEGRHDATQRQASEAHYVSNG